MVRILDKITMPFVKPTSVCALIYNGNKVLGVARRGTSDRWGLPGGSIELGETPKQAIIREVYEETGMIIIPSAFPKYKDYCGFEIVSTYKATYYGEPKQGDAGPVAWVDWSDLFEGPFGLYNKKLYEKIKWT